MNRRKLIATGYLLGSVALMVGIGIWNLVQSHRHVLRMHERWADRVTTRIMAERLSTSHSLENLRGMSREDIRHELFSRQDFVGAYWFDVQTHEFERWVIPSFERILKTPDPRLVVSQLRATEAHSTQMGPVLLLAEDLFTTAAVPLNSRHALVVVNEAPEIKKILEEESAWAHLHAFVYDSEHHSLFVGGNLASIEAGLSDVLTWAESGVKTGTVPLGRGSKGQWIATFHTVPALDWVFILTETTYTVYYPVLLYVGSLLCLLWLSGIPLKAAESLRRAREASALGQFAMRVENYVRGKDLILQEPPYPFKELAPIVHSLRWLVPLWKKAEAYPKEFGLERKLLSLLIESLPEGILFFNSQGALQLGNELGKVFLALQQDPGHEVKMVSGIQVPRGFLEPYAEPVFSGLQVNLGKEVEVGWADGKHLYRVWVEAVQVDEKVEGFIVVVRDITFRKQWEYVQEQVLSGITHDLRGPLSAIMGYIDLLKRQLKDGPPKAQEYVALAREAGNRLTQMISDILDVVRFEQGKIEMDVQSVPVEELFERVQNIFGVTANQKSVTLKLVMDHPGAIVTGDRKLLERVLDNLVGNAIKFTPSGGNITVTAMREGQRTIFSVADTGRGIPKEAQSRVFDKFQQVRPGDRSAGYGLGLAVVKFIVEAHKGEIRLESEVDKGSTFTFFVPDQPVTVKADASLEASDGEAARS
jgi:NtrC-family two-component system sensor histidine kinase KinB